MIFLFLLPFYLGVSSYMMFRFFYWMKHCNHRFNWLRFKVTLRMITRLGVLCPLLGKLHNRYPGRRRGRPLRKPNS